ncbi:MAG: hypothetical protein ACOX1O_07465 [Eggerthellaceae bacterium]|jgi:hypothetical protein
MTTIATRSRLLLIAALMAVLVGAALMASSTQAYAATYNLPLNKTKTVTSASNTATNYYKIKVPARGYLTLTMKIKDQYRTYGYWSIWICNGKKKSLQGKKARNYFEGDGAGDARAIGVKKGTYYLKVKNSSVYSYSIKVTETKVKGKGAAKKAKAKNLKRKKAFKGVVASGEKAQWFKIKNGKARILHVKFGGKTYAGGNYGGLKVRVYYKGHKLGSGTVNSSYHTAKLESFQKEPKGTYLVKVSGYSTGSGFYTLKWW